MTADRTPRALDARSRVLLALAAAVAAAVPAPAAADSSSWNLHLDPAFAAPVLGMRASGEGGLGGAGLFVWGGVDWQLAPPFALELLIGAGHVWGLGPGYDHDGNPETALLPQEGATFVHGGLGTRLRLTDDRSGYANQPGGSIDGSLWLSAHVGAMAWNGPELAIDLALGYELSVSRPISLGIFARGVLGLLGEDDDIDLVATLGLSLSFEVTVGVIPDGRYGVADVRVEGLEELDEAALRACLGTRERGTFGFDFGASTQLNCGEPPFDSGRVRLELFAWPWTEWPLFEASVFERDMLRVERWLRARGYYEGRVLASRVDPPEALGEAAPEGTRDGDRCLADPSRGCEVRVAITIDEGEPVRVARMSIRGEQDIEEGLRRQLRAALELRRGEPFDEALYERTQRAMVRVLADNGYPDARVEAEVKLNPARHEAYLVFFVETGARGVLGRICVTGYGELPPEPILAATFLGPGDEFSLSAIEEAQRAIFALGTMSSVEIRHATVRERDAQDAETAAAPETGAGAETEPAAEPAAEEEPEPGTRIDAETEAPVEEPANDQPERPPFCTDAPESVPAGARAVDLTIRVAPGRLERFGLGGGLQAGDTLSFGNQASGGVTTVNQQQLQQWDIHLLLVAEWRNLFGNMLRVRLEERPRLIFPAQFPGVSSDAGEGPTFGNRVGLTVRWPAFLEPRTALFAGLTHDYGPIPLWGFFRHELDARLGLERTFFDGRLYLSTAIRANLFLPQEEQSLHVRSQLDPNTVVFLEQIANLDLRDDPRNPTAGAFFSVGVQEAGVVEAQISSWNYIRILAEARGYVPLGAGIVLAARFGVGAMLILDVDPELRGTNAGNDDLCPDSEAGSENIYDLDQLGPLSQQLQGGGSISNRGFPPGLMGNVCQRQVETRPTYGGGRPDPREIIISGGTFRWEGSLELRFPLTSEIGLTLFTDVGDVSRRVNFAAINLAVGLGIRYRTIIGPLRFDIAYRPDELAYIGDDDPRVFCNEQGVPDNSGCTPYPEVLGLFPGAVHLTIGEAF